MLLLLRREAQPQRDEDGSRDALDRSADARPQQHVAGPGANCGKRLAKNTAIFGLPRLLMMPWRRLADGVNLCPDRRSSAGAACFFDGRSAAISAWPPRKTR